MRAGGTAPYQKCNNGFVWASTAQHRSCGGLFSSESEGGWMATTLTARATLKLVLCVQPVAPAVPERHSSVHIGEAPRVLGRAMQIYKRPTNRQSRMPAGAFIFEHQLMGCGVGWGRAVWGSRRGVHEGLLRYRSGRSRRTRWAGGRVGAAPARPCLGSSRQIMVCRACGWAA